MVGLLKNTLFIIGLLLVAGCAQMKDYSYGVNQINALNSKYNTTMETYPKDAKEIKLMIGDFKELKKLKLETAQEAFNYLVDFRTLNLEAEGFYIQGQKYGNTGTTKHGFGCKTRPLIIESAQLRNKSALKGFEAVVLLKDFIAKYPKEAKLAGFSNKNALFLNATYYRISEDAKKDSNTINHFCPQNRTFELYREEFRKKTNLSEDFINKLSYEEAVEIWKELRGIK